MPFKVRQYESLTTNPFRIQGHKQSFTKYHMWACTTIKPLFLLLLCRDAHETWYQWCTENIAVQKSCHSINIMIIGTRSSSSAILIDFANIIIMSQNMLVLHLTRCYGEDPKRLEWPMVTHISQWRDSLTLLKKTKVDRKRCN